MPARLADRITDARRRNFAGRRAELDLFRDMLAPGGAGSVLFVHGPGGVGKTTLLRQFAWLAADAGRPVVWLDGRDLGPTPETATAHLRETLGRDPAAAGPITGVPSRRDLAAGTDLVAEMPPRREFAAGAGPVAGIPAGALLVIDTAELLEPLDRRLRDELLANLPDDGLIVIAGRDAPSVSWRTDPGWRSVLRTLRLRNLDATEAGDLLRARGVPAGGHAAALSFTHGHPLALALLADVCAESGRFDPAATQETISVLVAELLQAVPSEAHRAALEACAQVRVTTEPVLAALLDTGNAREIFDWLRGLSIVEYSPRGIFPHDLAREVLAAELRWRHPDQRAILHRRARAYYLRRFEGADPPTQRAVLLDAAYLHRESPAGRPAASNGRPSC